MHGERLEACVLVVDDTPENLDLARQTLEGVGCEVMVATNGERALETGRRPHRVYLVHGSRSGFWTSVPASQWLQRFSNAPQCSTAHSMTSRVTYFKGDL